MSGPAAGLMAAALIVMTARADAQGRGDRAPAQPEPSQMQSASDAYWSAVYRSTGPIGLPRHMGDGESGRFRPRPPLRWPATYGYVPYVAPPDPVYVPVYVPGPVVYVPVPPPPAPAAAPVTTAPVVPAPRTPQTFYVIPGCYGGNVPPDPNTLPEGCDITKVRIGTW